jgi:hypothetical protein
MRAAQQFFSMAGSKDIAGPAPGSLHGHWLPFPRRKLELCVAMEVNFFMIKIEIPNQVRDDEGSNPSCHAEFISASHPNSEIN